MVQETKITSMDDVVANSFWNYSELGFSYSNSLGRSGGSLTLLNKENIEVLNIFNGDGFLGIKVCWKNYLYYMVNIYSSFDLSKKKVLWEDLLALMERFKDGDYIIGDNFNAIKIVSERKGRAVMVNYREVDLFADFINKSSLVYIPCKGKQFSWFNGDGKSKSIIDHFLLSSDVVNRWDLVGQYIGDRDISDHYPIWLLMNKSNWHPKPFIFNNKWFYFDSFVPFVEKEWNSLMVEGIGDYVLKEKLKL